MDPILDDGAIEMEGPTLTIDDQLTGAGSVLGTVSYMSPEQVRAKQLDARTDLFSFGVVLYEMATGKLPFRGENAAMIFDSILNRAPLPAARLNPELPAELARVIDKCLEKDRELRYQHASEVRADLQRLKRDTDSALVTTGARPGLAKRPKTIATAAAAALALLIAGAFYFQRALHATAKLTDKDTIVLADFRNTTGDSVFDETLRQGLAVQLEQSPYLSLISEERVQKELHLMGRPANTRLTPELARQVCERAGSAAVLEGSIAGLGSQYVLGLRANRCGSGEVIDEEQAQAERKEDVLKALSQVASKFRTRAGEALTTVEQHSTPLEEATTPSLEALRSYSTGLKLLLSKGDASALPLFKRAVEIDPKFAMAHAYVGRIYGDIGEYALSAESASKAYQLRDRVSDAEKFFIASAYDLQATGNMENAQRTFELWERTYPRDLNAPGLLSGMIYPIFGKWEKTIEEAKKAIAIDPDFPFAYVNLATGYQFFGRLKEAAATLQRASARKLDIPEMLVEQYDLAFVSGDREGMERAIVLGKERTGAEDWLSEHQGFVLAYSGRLHQAREMSRRAVGMARDAGQRERAALFETGATVWEALSGNAPLARQGAMAALALSKGRDVEYGAAFALALSGDSSAVQTIANDLQKRFPEDTSVRFAYLPELRAFLALNHGEPSKAVEALQLSLPYELGVPLSWFNGSFGFLYPAYVRGLAYLAGRRGAEAVAEFQKIVDHREFVATDPIGATARLQLGRALALSGDKTKAKAAYQDFLTLWKDADPDVPIFKQAKAEYARL